jgi:hypothetical protein
LWDGHGEQQSRADKHSRDTNPVIHSKHSFCEDMVRPKIN